MPSHNNRVFTERKAEQRKAEMMSKTDKQIDEQLNRKMDGWMNEMMDGWVDGWMNEDTSTQIQIITKRIFTSVYNDYKYNITLINPIAYFLNTNGLY